MACHLAKLQRGCVFAVDQDVVGPLVRHGGRFHRSGRWCRAPRRREARACLMIGPTQNALASLRAAVASCAPWTGEGGMGVFIQPAHAKSDEEKDHGPTRFALTCGKRSGVWRPKLTPVRSQPGALLLCLRLADAERAHGTVGLQAVVAARFGRTVMRRLAGVDEIHEQTHAIRGHIERAARGDDLRRIE